MSTLTEVEASKSLWTTASTTMVCQRRGQSRTLRQESARTYPDVYIYVFSDSKQSYAVYRFSILINPCDVVELDAELGNHILHHPLKAAQVFQSVS